jgi:Homing endonuclease associated repeat
VCAEGCFCISRRQPRFSVHLRQDDELLLRLLADESGLGRVTRFRPAPPLNPSATWTVCRRSHLGALRDLLWSARLPGRKLEQMEIWASAVDELERAARSRRHPRRELLERTRERLTEARASHPPRRAELLELPRRDLRSESLVALRTWSREHPGRLSCVEYASWRRRQRGHPTRDTIVRQFGSWHQALAAAGLDDRAARAPRPAGGEERRAARRVEQRARVVAAVRRFERERGRWPRALEFFKWRLESEVDAPTQGTVYRLFPGGWAEVLRQVAGATV